MLIIAKDNRCPHCGKELNIEDSNVATSENKDVAIVVSEEEMAEVLSECGIELG